MLRINYDDVPEAGNTGRTHTFSIEFQSWFMQIKNAASNLPSATPAIVGISPGGTRNTLPMFDFSQLLLGPTQIMNGAPGDAFYECFGQTGMPGYLSPSNRPYDLAGATLSFIWMLWPAPHWAFVPNL